MDGVIVDSEPRHERAFLEVVRDIGYSDRHGMRFSDYIGRSDQELWRDFVARNQPAHALNDLLAMKRSRMIDIIQREKPIFEGLLDLVRALKPHFALALASGSERQVIEEVLRLDGLRDCFPVVVSSSEVAHGKPSPDVFLRAASLLDVPPERCWVIEDSRPGVAAGLAAGMRVVAITNTHSALELAQAHHVVSSYSEIQALLTV
jgi:HAD superfamily hydrolase (TIGR01509 family)